MSWFPLYVTAAVIVWVVLIRSAREDRDHD
jgi:hypothetical protein